MIELFTFTTAAWDNIAATDADALADAIKVRDGRLTRDSLLLFCLDGADPDYVQGWRDYVDEVCRVADLPEFRSATSH